jgi:hypothetical protein
VITYGKLKVLKRLLQFVSEAQPGCACANANDLYVALVVDSGFSRRIHGEQILRESI